MGTLAVEPLAAIGPWTMGGVAVALLFVLVLVGMTTRRGRRSKLSFVLRLVGVVVVQLEIISSPNDMVGGSEDQASLGQPMDEPRMARSDNASVAHERGGSHKAPDATMRANGASAP